MFYSLSYAHTILQSAFSEDGLLKLWTELSKDGEIQGSGGTYRDRREQEAENVKFRTSPFDTFLTEWTWGEVRVAGVAKELDSGGEEEAGIKY